jgi:poly(A) polymerase
MNNIEKILAFDFVKDFAEINPSANLYLVGGAVRDAFLGIESSDFDLVAENITWDELISYLERYGKVAAVEGRNFGVVKFTSEKPSLNLPLKNRERLNIDIALPRSEVYLQGGRRKDASIQTESMTIYDDLLRRDFTINAMAIDLRTSNQKLDQILSVSLVPCSWSLVPRSFIDPYGGLNDLEKKLICAVGDPAERFLEDPTRILRGIRFAVRFGFEIEQGTKAAMKELLPEIFKKYCDEAGREVPRVSFEMIGQEFLRAIIANPAETIYLYDEIGVLAKILPEVKAMQGVEQPREFHSEGDVYIHTMMALRNLTKDASPELKIATLLHDIGKPPTFRSAAETGDRIRFSGHDAVGTEMARAILNRLRYPGRFIDDVAYLIKNHMRLPFHFPQMKEEKQRAFVRDPRFYELLSLVEADAKASIWANGNYNLEFLPPVQKVLAEIEADKKAGRPLEIITGDEIIAEIRKLQPSFDPKKEGKIVGTIKKTINCMYDKKEFEGKEAALSLVNKLYEKYHGKKAQD